MVFVRERGRNCEINNKRKRDTEKEREKRKGREKEGRIVGKKDRERESER